LSKPEKTEYNLSMRAENVGYKRICEIPRTPISSTIRA